MIVLGADAHKRSHTIAAIAASTGDLLGERTIAVGGRGFDVLLQWARSLDGKSVNGEARPDVTSSPTLRRRAAAVSWRVATL